MRAIGTCFDVVDRIRRISLPVDDLLRFEDCADRPTPTDVRNVRSSKRGTLTISWTCLAFAGFRDALRGAAHGHSLRNQFDQTTCLQAAVEDRA
jgi:hypothetical protein